MTAVLADLVGGDFLHCEDAAAILVVYVEELLGGAAVVQDHVVGEYGGEGFVADGIGGHEDGVAQAQGLGLLDEGEAGEFGDGGYGVGLGAA